MEAASSCPCTSETVFEMQKRIHAQRDAKESVLFDLYVMETIFHKLDLNDQNNFRLVCEDWYEMAHEYWLKSSFNCEEEFYKLKKTIVNEDIAFESLISLIKERPLLKRIACNLWNDRLNLQVIDTMLLYVEDLHHVDLGYVTFSQVKTLVRKYKNLTTVVLDTSSPDLEKSVECLGKCENLEKLKFLNYWNVADHPSAVCKAIATNFPKLKELSLVLVKCPDTVKELEHLLRKRSGNFSQLRLVLDEYSGNIGSVLGLCETLKSLQLVLLCQTAPLQLSGLKNLQNLYIDFFEPANNEVVEQTITSVIREGPLKHLKVLTLYLTNSCIDLTPIIDNLKNLENLTLGSGNSSTVSTLLKRLSDLRNLSTLHIFHAELTEENVKHIAACKNLKRLFLICQFTDRMILLLKNCTSLESLKLFDTKQITFNCIIQFIKSARNLKKLYLPWSSFNLNQREETLKLCKHYKIEAHLD